MASKLTQEQMQAACWAYEEAMDGQRLPDGNGYDFEVVTKMYEAILANAPQPDTVVVDREILAIWASALEKVAANTAYNVAQDIRALLDQEK